MQTILKILEKKRRIVIGLMSGTCTDGIDAALVCIEGSGKKTKAELLEFLTIPYTEEIRSKLIEIASQDRAGSSEISKVNFLLGHLFSKACLEVCRQAGISSSQVDFIGSHGHTIYHQPEQEVYMGYPITSTLQIGEAALIAEKIGCPVISDFRVRDMAAGGQGAPLVPYTEYLLYSEEGRNVALQNIGGIGNITFLPGDGLMEHIIAFDTGPGNMVIDALVSYYTQNERHFDEEGKIAAKGQPESKLLEWMLQDEYLVQKPPKTTGREKYGSDYIAHLIQKAQEYNISMEDLIATATMLTARSIEMNVKRNLPELPERLIVGGGGSKNTTLMRYLRDLLKPCEVITNEALGLNSDAKEAIAFAVLANEALHGTCNNIPAATGASHGAVLGKITL